MPLVKFFHRISRNTVISFLVDVELGWKLSLLAGISSTLFIVSIIAMLKGSFSNMPLRNGYIWFFLSMLSLASVIILVMKSAEKVQG